MNWYSIPDKLWSDNQAPFWPVLLLFISVLLAAADHALYRSKANGRNRVELAIQQ